VPKQYARFYNNPVSLSSSLLLSLFVRSFFSDHHRHPINQGHNTGLQDLERSQPMHAADINLVKVMYM